MSQLENIEMNQKPTFFSDLLLTLPKKIETTLNSEDECNTPKVVERIYSFGGGLFGLELACQANLL